MTYEIFPLQTESCVPVSIVGIRPEISSPRASKEITQPGSYRQLRESAIRLYQNYLTTTTTTTIWHAHRQWHSTHPLTHAGMTSNTRNTYSTHPLTHAGILMRGQAMLRDSYSWLLEPQLQPFNGAPARGICTTRDVPPCWSTLVAFLANSHWGPRATPGCDRTSLPGSGAVS